jgi:hypothetical protein
MKNKLFILMAVMLILALALPTAALAVWTSFSGILNDYYGNPYTNGCNVYVHGKAHRVWNPANPLPQLPNYGASTCDGSGNFTVAVSGVPSDETELVLVIDPGAGTQGDPAPFKIEGFTLPSPNIPFPRSLEINGPNFGPNAVVVQSLSTQNAVAAWLPYVLVIGSLALVSGALAVARKRRS